jgi:UPF0755 protein
MSRRGLVLFVFSFVAVVLLLTAVLLMPFLASLEYGPPSPSLSPWPLLRSSTLLLWYDGLLTEPPATGGAPQSFQVKAGESASAIALRLQEVGLIDNADAFRTYLIYSGLDTTIQAGDYQFSPDMSILDIAHALQDATPTQVTFTVLAGWRIEEIAASLPSSGLEITPEEFIAAAALPPQGFDYLSGVTISEGFLYPDSYVLPREVTADQLVNEMLRNFAINLSGDLRQGFEAQGLSIYQAVILASLVQREAVEQDEGSQIASVFINRLKAGDKLDSDPTVQYALGYNQAQATWWTNPLSLHDLKVDSPYNTYLYPGLPPAPIANPGLSALRAVAHPAKTPYYYFRARCDGSGRHVFAETFEQQQQNACP